MGQEKLFPFSQGEQQRLEDLRRLYWEGKIGGPEDKPSPEEKRVGRVGVKEESDPMDEHLSGKKHLESLQEGLYIWLRDNPENPLLIAFDFVARLYPEFHVEIGIFPDREGREIPGMKAVWIKGGHYSETAPKLYELKEDPAMVYLNMVFSMFGAGIDKDIERAVEKNYISEDEAKFILGFGYGRQIKQLGPEPLGETRGRILSELKLKMDQSGIRVPSLVEVQNFILSIVEKHLGKITSGR